jgi:hypothetical protein
MTVRAVSLAIILVICLSLLTPYEEFVISGAQIGAFAPPGGALLFFLFLIFILNPALKRLRAQPLSGSELSVIYAALLSMAVIPSCQFAGWIFTVVTGPFYYANEANEWAYYWNLIPSFWGPRGGKAVTWFYEGLPEGAGLPFSPWIPTFLSWGFFIFVFYLCGLCLSVILRRQWVEIEKLSFPLARLPLELAERGDRLMGNRLLWLGAAIPIFFHLLNGLGRIYPSMPRIRLELISLDTLFSERPWSAIRPFSLSIYFSLIGFSFLCGRDVPLSMWVFYLLFKLECVMGSAFGWMAGESRSLRSDLFPLIVGQQTGSILALVSAMLWISRRHIGSVVRSAISGGGDDDEPTSYRVALFGFVIGFLLLCAWCTISGMPFWLSFVFLGLTFAFMVGAHRMMAEGGVNFLWAAQSGPNFLIYAVDGGRWLNRGSWYVLFSLPYFLWNFKGPVGPQTLEGFKLTTETKANSRGFFKLLVFSMGIAIVVSFWWTLYLVYTQGGGIMLDAYRFVHVGQRPMEELHSVVENPVGTSTSKLASVFLSVLFTWFLSAMRWRFTWWRLHPLGYAASTIWAIHFMWFSMMVGSLMNSVITRYGGFRAYRRSRPFFLGLILGEFLMIGFFMILRSALGARGADWERTIGGLF